MPSRALARLDEWLRQAEEVLAEQQEHDLSAGRKTDETEAGAEAEDAA